MASAQGKKMSREEFRKAKELEEARKAGTAAPETDADGKIINPHIPVWMAKAPWYVDKGQPGLQHQNNDPTKRDFLSTTVNDGWYARGSTAAQQTEAPRKFKKGACQNCGSTSHKKADCLERPRKIGAKFSNKSIAAADVQQPDLSLGFEGKRDRWNGYDAEDYQRVVEEHERVELAKRLLKEKRLEEEEQERAEREEAEAKEKGEEQTSTVDGPDEEATVKETREGGGEESSGDEDDEFKYGDDMDMPGSKFDDKKRITVRNLRIREDIPKYLLNLDPNSAHYDPKTRSMRGNPFAHTGKDPRELTYAGDNFVRISGDTPMMAKQQLFAWDASSQSSATGGGGAGGAGGLHMQADPTLVELAHREYRERKDKAEGESQKTIVERYGGKEHLDAPPKELLLAQSEHYVEYSRTGKVIRGQERAIAKSKYVEDEYVNNHKSVWGSFWEEGQWGYGCCHSTVRNSYCVGEAGRSARAQAERVMMKQLAERKAAAAAGGGGDGVKSMVELHRERKEKEAGGKKEKGSRKGKREEEEREDREKRKKLADAIAREERRSREAERVLKMDERKRPYSKMGASEQSLKPTEEDMEAYHLKRQRTEDPMAKFLGKNDDEMDE